MEGSKEPTKSRSAREERLLEEMEGLKARVRELEGRVEAIAGARRADEGRVRTHVSGFDEALEGGVPAGHVVLVAGPSGTMKTSLALSMVHRNRASGVKGLYVSLEEGRASLLRTMSRLGMETKDDFIVDIARLRTEHAAAQETRDWLQILRDYLERRREKEPFGLLVVDPLNSLYALANLREPRGELFHFFTFLRGLGVTSVLIAEAENDAAPFPHHEDFLADGAIQLRYSDVEDGRVAVEIRCLKMRHANHSRDWFRLEFGPEGFAARPRGPQ